VPGLGALESVGPVKTAASEKPNAAGTVLPVIVATMPTFNVRMETRNGKIWPSRWVLMEQLAATFNNSLHRQLSELIAQVQAYEALLQDIYPRLDIPLALHIDQNLNEVCSGDLYCPSIS
jgi:hypothetical protein